MKSITLNKPAKREARPKSEAATRPLARLGTNLPTGTPLANLLALRHQDQEFTRLRRMSRFLEHFHLKYTVTSKVNGRHAEINGRLVVNFGSANYLGLDQHPEVLRASKQALDELGTHAGCSRVFSSQANIVALEQELSALVGAEETMIGHNVTQIHAGVLPALFSDAESVLFLDRYAHTSMHQAALIATAKGARLVRVDVSDEASLLKILDREQAVRGALLVDGVYSMQGHVPALRRLDELCRERGLVLYVDDAHGVGAYGTNGGGVVEACGLSFDNLLLVGSLQKALGTYGGFLSGPAPLVDYLRVTSKAYIFSGTLQPSAVEGARAAVRVARSEEGRLLREKLASYSRRLRAEISSLGFSVPEGEGPIVPVAIGGDMATLVAGRKLFDLGIYLNSVLFPAVPRGQGILRISLTTLHSEEDLAMLVDGFRELKAFLDSSGGPLRRALQLAYHVGKSKWQGSRYAGL